METRPALAAPFIPQSTPRADPAPVRGAVATDLAVPQAVAAQAGAEQTRWRKARSEQHEATEPFKDHHVITDRETGDLVFQVIDPVTFTVVTQTPNEQILKLRAYLDTLDHMRAVREAGNEGPEAHHTDASA